jgi:type II secretory pathway component PulF
MARLRKPFEGTRFDTGKVSLLDKIRNANLGAVLGKLGIATDAAKTDNEGPGWYRYSAINGQGLRQRGKMQAPNPKAVSDALQNDGWIPLEIKAQSSGGVNTDLGALFGTAQVRMSLSELSTFSRQLAELLKAGVPLTRSLTSLGEEQSEKMQKITSELSNRVSAGVPLSQALTAFPLAFDDVFCAYVAAGESAGTLPMTIGRLAKSLERRHNMAQKIKGVTAYPKVVGGMIGLVVIGIMQFLMPQFEGIYAGYGAELPAPTRLVMDFSESFLPIKFDFTLPLPWFIENEVSIGGLFGRLFAIIVGYSLLEVLRIRRGKPFKMSRIVIRIIVLSMFTIFAANISVNAISTISWSLILGSIFTVIFYIEAKAGDQRIVKRVDGFRFKAPLLGELFRLNCMYRWASTLAGSLESGVPMARALELAGATAGSRWHSLVSRDLQLSIRSGKPLSEGLAAHSDLYPPSVRAMIATGESTGDVGTMLESVASSIDSESDAIMSGLAAKMEVALLVVLGVVVGGLIIIMYLPILNMASQGFSQGG